MQLAKAFIYLPYNIDDVWACWWNTDIMEKFDPMVFKGRKATKFSPPPQQDDASTTKSSFSYQKPNGGYAHSLNVSNINFFPVKRTLHYTSTMVRDSEIDAILLIGHSSENLKEDFPDEEIEHKLLQGFFYWSLFKVNDKLTRVMISTYSEINIPIFSSFFYKQMAMKRTKSIRKSMMKELDRLTDYGRKKMDTSSFVDELNFRKCLEENCVKYPNRSWYKEWLALKQNPTQF